MCELRICRASRKPRFCGSWSHVVAYIDQGMLWGFFYRSNFSNFTQIPYPLDPNEVRALIDSLSVFFWRCLCKVQTVSQRAVYLWTGRDAANVGFTIPHSKAGSVVSSYNGTVLGKNKYTKQGENHYISCDACDQVRVLATVIEVPRWMYVFSLEHRWCSISMWELSFHSQGV